MWLNYILFIYNIPNKGKLVPKKKDTEILYALMQNNGNDSSSNYNDENMSYAHGHSTYGSLELISPFNNFGVQVLIVLPLFYIQRKYGKQVK